MESGVQAPSECVRPGDEPWPVGDRDAEQLADHRDGQRQRQPRDQVELSSRAVARAVEQRGGQHLDARREFPHPRRGEGP
jgi:hypothetical protein